MRQRLAGALLALPLVLALALAGCGGSDDDDDGIATAGNDPTEQPDSGDGSEGPLSEEELHEAQLEFAQCMREHGIDVQDPEPGEGLAIQNEGDPAEADAAMEACQHLLPNGGKPSEENPEEREEMLEMAQCMRDNGVESFPDPRPGEGISIGPEQAEDPDFDAAQEKCNEKILGGQPPDTDTNGGGGS